MESAESSPASPLAGSHLSPRPGRSRLGELSAVVLQVDATASCVDGLGWLSAQRDDATLRRLRELQVEGMAEGWSHDELVRGRLALLRPRRAEINALGEAYRRGLAPGVVDFAHRVRRAGVDLLLTGEVAVESLFGVADALGVVPGDIHAPRLRFDALGAFAGSVVAGGSLRGDAPEAPHGAPAPARRVRLFIGTRQSRMLLAGGGGDEFLRFTGFVAHEGGVADAGVASFAELSAAVGV